MVLEKLIGFICTEIGLDESDVDEGSVLCELVGDEVEATELALALESEFGIDIGGELDCELTVAALAEIIEEEELKSE